MGISLTLASKRRAMRYLKRVIKSIAPSQSREGIRLLLNSIFLITVLASGAHQQHGEAQPKKSLGQVVESSASRSDKSRCEPLQRSSHYLRTGRLIYLERESTPNVPTSPIVIALHGLGHNKEGFSKVAHRLPASWRVIFIDAPLHYGRGWAWYRFRCIQAAADLSQSVEALYKTVAEIKRRYPRAPKPALFGFSQGGVMTLSAIAKHPSEWSSAASLSGYWLSEDPLKASSLNASPELLIAHGELDRVVPVSRGFDAAKVMGKAGALVAWFVFQGGHQVSSEVIEVLTQHVERGWSLSSIPDRRSVNRSESQ